MIKTWFSWFSFFPIQKTSLPEPTEKTAFPHWFVIASVLYIEFLQMEVYFWDLCLFLLSVSLILYCFNYWSFTRFWYSLIENLFSVQETRDVGLIAGWEDPLSRKWQPAPVFLPGKLHLQRSLVGYSPWSGNESSMIEQHTRWSDNFSNVVLQEHLDDFGLFYFVSLFQFF